MKVRQLIFGLAVACFLAACATANESYEIALKRESKGDASKSPETAVSEPVDDAAAYQLAELSPGERPPVDSDEAGLWMMMDKAEDRVKTSGRRYRDKALNDYVRDVVCRVSRDYCRDIRVYIMRVPYFNATMAPNGAMEIWSGLLLRVQNEAQLASIIGHELGHYLRRHSLKRMQSVIDTSGGLAAFQVVLATVGLGSLGNLATLAALGGLQAYSRDFEREADGYGVVLMSKAGYDPKESAKVWERLTREQKADDEEGSTYSFLSTHPESEERLAALKLLANKVQPQHPEGRDSSVTFRAVMRPYRGVFLSDELNLRRFKRTEELLKILREDNGEQPELLFYQGELYRLRNEKGDRERALATYRKALSVGKPPAEVHKSMGLILLKTKQRDAARRSLAQYLKEKPDASDARMIQHLMQGNRGEGK